MRMFGTLMEVLEKSEDEELKIPVVDRIFDFLWSEESEQLALSWLDKRYIHSAKEPEVKLYELKESHLRSICTSLFKSNRLSTDEKMQLLEKVLADDKSDIARDVRAQCMTSIADPAVKEQAWQDITDPKSPISNKLKEAKMQGFYSWSQYDLVQPYFDRYYEELKDFDKRHSNQYVNSFIRCMRPTMEVLDSHIVKLATIKGNVPDTNSAYKKKLEENIELLLRAQTLREMALKEANE